MKRNKRIDILSHEDLTPLTELILAQMGPKGADIRKRLKKLYRTRAMKKDPAFPEPLDKTA